MLYGLCLAGVGFAFCSVVADLFGVFAAGGGPVCLWIVVWCLLVGLRFGFVCLFDFFLISCLVALWLG